MPGARSRPRTIGRPGSVQRARGRRQGAATRKDHHPNPLTTPIPRTAPSHRRLSGRSAEDPLKGPRDRDRGTRERKHGVRAATL
eukprot:10494521-Heterocapsa_arctica.AAC.1